MTTYIRAGGHAYDSDHLDSWWLKEWRTACGLDFPPQGHIGGNLTCADCRDRMKAYLCRVARDVGLDDEP